MNSQSTSGVSSQNIQSCHIACDTVCSGLSDSYSHYKVKKRNGTVVFFNVQKILDTLKRNATGLQDISIELVAQEVVKNIYDGITTQELERAMILAAVALLELDCSYNLFALRLFLQMMYKDAFGVSTKDQTFSQHYRQVFIKGIGQGIEHKIFTPQLLEFDLQLLAQHLHHERDYLLNYLGLQTLYDRYFIKVDKKKIELPQAFWMRVAMGLAINEPNKNERAIEFYNVLSNLLYVSSTPTLFHSGFVVPQLSSCYLTTVKDDLGHIFKCIGDNAQLAKWAGGIGNDWTNIRGTGSLIKSIHATSQGVIPFLKIANDVVVGITHSGIRRGGTCVYLETWHLDIEDFLDLRRNTGDERRRTHDMHTANWIPDLFMQRVEQDADWTLFSPDEVPDLHGLYGKAFAKRYEEYEQMAKEGKIKQFNTVSALKLWRKMLSRLFETGHPWITFKDPCNVRSPQDHVGVVNSSNLCTEITLNTSEEETAVCNLGSINVGQHINNGVLDEQLLEKTIKTAIRMLDNVIDLNFYPTKEAERSNLRHRPIGLGCMGFQDGLFKLGIPFDSQEAITMADNLQEKILYHALESSCQLAQERGTYPTYKGSKWDRGIFPQDTIDLLEQERGSKIEVSRGAVLDWTPLRQKVKQYGLRNSNVIAIAPTATIANIAGCYPSIEPIYKNIYVKSNIAGEFTILNKYLVEDLKALGLWNQDIRDQMKYYDGDISMIQAIPERIRRKYKTAFELHPIHLIHISAARGKWIDQSQSHNVFMQGVSGKMLHDIYFAAWKTGMKTTYYLRTLGASQIEKSTLDAKKFGFTQKREYKQFEQATGTDDVGIGNGSQLGTIVRPATDVRNVCDLTNDTCESCQ